MDWKICLMLLLCLDSAHVKAAGKFHVLWVKSILQMAIRHFSLLNVTAAGACGYDFPCDGERLVRAYLRRRRGTI